MDTKKRTTIIVLLFLTILLAVVSVFVTIQIQRNNAARDSQAAPPFNLTYEYVYKDLNCSNIFNQESEEVVITPESDVQFSLNNYVCNFTLNGNVEFSVNLLRETYSDINTLKTQLESEFINLNYAAQSIYLDDIEELILLGSTETNCTAYIANNVITDSYLTISFGEVANCTSETLQPLIKSIVDQLAYRLFNYFA